MNFVLLVQHIYPLAADQVMRNQCCVVLDALFRLLVAVRSSRPLWRTLHENNVIQKVFCKTAYESVVNVMLDPVATNVASPKSV